MKKKIITFLLLFISSFGFSQTLMDTIAQIEKAMAIYLPQNPGCQLSIKKNGRTIFSKAYGMADLEHDVPMGLTSKIEAGSVSKQFTAAAILLLEQQGKLSLNDDIRKFIPEFPNYGQPITLAHMMHHTSGIKDWGSIASLTGEGRFTKNYTNDDALRIVIAQKTLNNIPGEEHIYSNSNYNLLAIVVQRASGQSLADFTKQHIFIPAGMADTEWRDNHKRIVKGRAVAYRMRDDTYETEMPNEDSYGNGGLITTTEDLLKWNDFYRSGKLGSPSLFAGQTTVRPLNNGKPNNYAAGLEITAYKGNTLITHNGATAGYRSFLDIFPDLDLSIAFLSNTSEFDGKVALDRAIRDVFVKDLLKPVSEATAPTITISDALLQSYSGWYKSERNGAGLMVELKDGSLHINGAMLNAESNETFRMGTGGRKVIFNAGRKRMDITSDAGNIPFVKAASANAGEKPGRYTGKYFSEETNSFLHVTIMDEMPVISFKPGVEAELKPSYAGGFDIPNWGNLYFTKDKKGNVTGMMISVGRARNVAFKKVD